MHLQILFFRFRIYNILWQWILTFGDPQKPRRGLLKLIYLNLYFCTRISITQRTSLDRQHMSRLPTYFPGKSRPDLSVQGQWIDSCGCIRNVNLGWLIKDLILLMMFAIWYFLSKKFNITYRLFSMRWTSTCCKEKFCKQFL